jgi:hypothetical protein
VTFVAPPTRRGPANPPLQPTSGTGALSLFKRFWRRSRLSGTTFGVSGILRGRELRGYETDNHRPEVSYAEPKKRSPYRRGTFLA